MEYKDASFYTDFFKNHSDFEILEEFQASNNPDEKNMYIGKITVKDTIHPLELMVEIPFTFPHHKLTFWTKSLSGYPHLIGNTNSKKGAWFCLNTPFAETPELQLSEEIRRLKEWINRQMREDLPAIIKDEKFIQSLRIANAYEWENPDEMNEFRSSAMLTFVGNFWDKAENFKTNRGHLHCIRRPDHNFYVLEDRNDIATTKIPYIIVEEAPSSREILNDFISLKEFYGWDDEICSFLLPQISTSSKPKLTVSSEWDKIEINKEEGLKTISQLLDELSKEISYIAGKKSSNFQSRFSRVFTKKEEASDFKQIKVLPSYKPLLISHLKEIEAEFRSYNQTQITIERTQTTVLETLEDEYEDQYAQIEDWNERGQYVYHHFLLGIKHGSKIQWLIMYTNAYAPKKEDTYYDLGVEIVSISYISTVPMRCLGTEHVTPALFWGRGSLSTPFKEKKIALVGLGAIGSMVAESLAHSGISQIALWDSDIVEPGNLCRSAYTLSDIGQSKVDAIRSLIRKINPYIQKKDIIRNGCWLEINPNHSEYKWGSFYDNINYANQEDVKKELQDYDLVIDCTGSNEMLHFLSYAFPEKDIVSLCITNKAQNLICVTNKDGNPFELRKAYLSRIEQDTKNFYMEGSGCYSPTFIAKYSDIAALVNLLVRNLDSSFAKGELLHSCIISYCESGILTDRIETYSLPNYNLKLNIPHETFLNALDMSQAEEGYLGYVLGAYSNDGNQIMITHIAEYDNANEDLKDTFITSKGIIDYIGDFAYSESENDSYSEQQLTSIRYKAENQNINTNNPLLILKHLDGSISFHLYINGELVKFEKE